MLEAQNCDPSIFFAFMFNILRPISGFNQWISKSRRFNINFGGKRTFIFLYDIYYNDSHSKAQLTSCHLISLTRTRIFSSTSLSAGVCSSTQSKDQVTPLCWVSNIYSLLRNTWYVPLQSSSSLFTLNSIGCLKKYSSSLKVKIFHFTLFNLICLMRMINKQNF